MSNQKIRSWIYRAVALLILFGAAWFLLLRESLHTEEYIKSEYFSAHSQALETIVSYLCDKCGDQYIDITDLPTIDNRGFGVPSEDTPAYRAYSDGIFEVMETAFQEIIYDNGSVQFVSHKSGGFLVQDYVIVAYKEDDITVKKAPRTILSGEDWTYFVVKEKD